MNGMKAVAANSFGYVGTVAGQLWKYLQGVWVGVKLDALQPANAERREAVLMLEPSKLPLDSSASTVKLAPSFCLARDERVEPVGFTPD